MAYSIAKPFTFAALMALGLAGCNNSSQTATDEVVADGEVATEANPNGTLQKIKDRHYCRRLSRLFYSILLCWR